MRGSSPFPTTAIRVSMTSSAVLGICLTSTFPLHPSDFPSAAVPSTSPPTPLVNSSWQSALAALAASTNLLYAASHSSLVSLIPSPFSSYPTSNTVSPSPSRNLSASTSVSPCSAPASVDSSRSRSFRRGDASDRSRASSRSSSSSWCSRVSVLVGAEVEAAAAAGAAGLGEGKRSSCCFSTYSAKSLSAASPFRFSWGSCLALVVMVVGWGVKTAVLFSYSCDHCRSNLTMYALEIDLSSK